MLDVVVQNICEEKIKQDKTEYVGDGGNTIRFTTILNSEVKFLTK